MNSERKRENLNAAEKQFTAKIFKENLHTSVNILQICMIRSDLGQRSLKNPAARGRKPGILKVSFFESQNCFRLKSNTMVQYEETAKITKIVY